MMVQFQNHSAHRDVAQVEYRKVRHREGSPQEGSPQNWKIRHKNGTWKVRQNDKCHGHTQCPQECLPQLHKRPANTVRNNMNRHA